MRAKGSEVVIAHRCLANRVAVTALAITAACLSVPASGGEDNPAVRQFDNALRRSTAVQGEVRSTYTMAERMEHYRVPGVSVAVIEGCRIIDARGFGRSPSGAAIDPHTMFQAGSISKVVTAVAVLKLVEEGRLTLDGDIGKHLKSWTLPRAPQVDDTPVSVRMLLNHTAGINEIGGIGYARGAPLPTLLEILNGSGPANTPPVRIHRTPGERWEYSSGGYYVLEAILSDGTREPFPDLADRMVLGPAGMAESAFAQPLPARAGFQAATSVGPDGSPLDGGWRVNPELAAGGLWSTPSDIARLAIAISRSVRREAGGILGEDAATAMMTRGPGNWGLGLDLASADGPRRFGHTGHNTGYVSEFVMYPDTCQGAVVMTNADQGGWLVTEVLGAIGDVYNWPEQRPREMRTSIPLTDDIAERFSGNYQLRAYPAERFSVSRKSDGSLQWAREGYIGRDLLPESETRLFSPDSRMTLDAFKTDEADQCSIELNFGGGNNIADRAGGNCSPKS